jgi:hypothetical protein
LALDIFGEVTAASGDRTSDVKIVTRSRIFDPNQPPGRPFHRKSTATIRIAPNEVVSVQLPQVVDASAFASRALSFKDSGTSASMRLATSCCLRRRAGR